MAVIAFFDDDRHREDADMNRNTHWLHPLPGSVANRLPLCAVPAAEAALK